MLAQDDLKPTDEKMFAHFQGHGCLLKFFLYHCGWVKNVFTQTRKTVTFTVVLVVLCLFQHVNTLFTTFYTVTEISHF